MTKLLKEDALKYHSVGRPGKLEVIPTKPYSTQYDLSLAYSPGVAEPCIKIQKNPEEINKYTTKGNLVAVISNGTAVLGLGNIGALASKPVMEGKGLLFKVFADVDVFDIEIEENDIKKFIEVVKKISPTFGGINLEDIKAPECFEIEETLKKELDIPVFHDDQHGTAIISGAGLLNALEINKKQIQDLKLVVNGAGASAISCTKLYISLGIKPENIVMLDSKGVIRKDRNDLNEYKQQFTTSRNIYTLEEAMKDADIFLGLSVAGVLTKEMVKSMAQDPIVFAMANPDPEISYEDALDARKDIIFATGRSDYPNQINNVLGFPFIFRGALDVGAKAINEEMKIAAVKALAELAKEDVPESVNIAYKTKNLSFGHEYIIPKPLDPRLISTISPAVAKAAIDSGVAKFIIKDWNKYIAELNKRLGLENEFITSTKNKARKSPKKIVFTEAENYNMLKAIQQAKYEGVAQPVILGEPNKIKNLAKEYNIKLNDIPIISIDEAENMKQANSFASKLFEKSYRKGLSTLQAKDLMKNKNYLGMMMVANGDADAFISGLSFKITDVIQPAMQILGAEKPFDNVAGMYIILTKKGPVFFADTSINSQPSLQDYVSIALLTAKEVKKFDLEPKIAFVSHSNFGSNRLTSSKKIHEAVKVLHKGNPELIVDGEMEADLALHPELRQKLYPFCKLGNNEANILIFPDLDAGNIAAKLMQTLGGTQILGPILLGLQKPINIVKIDSSVEDIVNLASITSIK